MDRHQIKNAIIKRISASSTDEKFLHSYYGYDEIKKCNLLFIITDKRLFIWEDIEQNLNIRTKKYSSLLSEPIHSNGKVILEFSDEKFAINEIDQDSTSFFKFIEDFFTKNNPMGFSDKKTNMQPINKVDRDKSIKKHPAVKKSLTPEIPTKPANRDFRKNALDMFGFNGDAVSSANDDQKTSVITDKPKQKKVKKAPKQKRTKAPKKSGKKMNLMIIIIPVLILIIVGVIIAFFLFSKTDSDENQNKLPSNEITNNVSQTTNYTKTLKEAELKITDLEALNAVYKKHADYSAMFSDLYNSYKVTPAEFDFDAAINSIIELNDKYSNIKINEIELKSKIKGNVEGQYIYTNLKNNETTLNDLLTIFNINLNNKFSDNGRIVEMNTLMETLSTNNKTVKSLLNDEFEIFNKELEKYDTDGIKSSTKNEDDSSIEVKGSEIYENTTAN